MLPNLSDNNGFIFGSDPFPEFVATNVEALQNALPDLYYKQHVLLEAGASMRPTV